MKTAHTLYYNRPATDWNEALPLGCGSHGALVYGQYGVEDILLNNDTFWAGLPVKNDYKQNGLYVGAARELIDAGEYEQATLLVEKHMLGEVVEAYLPIGHMKLEFLPHTENVSSYKRTLDLESAVYSCDYTADGNKLHREGFISYPHKTFFQKFTCDNKKLCVNVSLYSDIRSDSYVENGILKLKGCAPIHSVGASDRNFKTVYDNSPNAVGNRFEISVALNTDGKICESGNRLTVTDASYIEIYQTSETSFIDWKTMPTKDPSVACAERISKAVNDGYDKAKEIHIADYTALYSRCELTLSQNENSTLPTDERLNKFNENASDAELCALYFHFGRYLMIASERDGTAPGTLQGIWNWDPKPIWECDMHTNINLEMNYWCAENTNLSECRSSLLEFLKGLCESGKKTARDLHSCRGSCMYSTTDIWCKTTPTSGYAVWGYWPMGQAWLAMDIFDHYEYTKDIDFLKEYYGILKENALFLYDWSYFDEKTGYYVTSPSTSPEHAFYFENENGERKAVSVSKASTCDMSIIREIFSDFIKASKILGCDEDLAKKLAQRTEKLYPHKILDDGTLSEWFCDFEPMEEGHRHVSHLISVYPGELINKTDTPELFEAAKKSLNKRLDHGGGNTGWSCAWAIALLAKFGQKDRAEDYIKRLFRDSTCPNLFDLHPPHIFQIDGNFGAPAAFGELFVQNENGEIILLPCVPDMMKDGSVRGLRAKGAISIDLEWHDGKLVSAALTPDKDGEFTVRYGEKTVCIKAKSRERNSLCASEF